MNVSSVGGSSQNAQAMAAKMTEKIMKEADTDGNGTISKDELTALKASKGGKGPDVAQVFSKFNTEGNGELTKEEVQKSIEEIGKQMQAKGGGAPHGGGGPPPSGGGGAAGGSGSAKTSTDPKDTNGDGTVSQAEETAYDIKHPEATKTGASSSSADKVAAVVQKFLEKLSTSAKYSEQGTINLTPGTEQNIVDTSA